MSVSAGISVGISARVSVQTSVLKTYEQMKMVPSALKLAMTPLVIAVIGAMVKLDTEKADSSPAALAAAA